MNRATPLQHLALRPLALCLSFGMAWQGVGAAEPLATAVERPALHPQVGPTVVVRNCNDAGTDSLRDAYFHAVDGETIDLTQLACSTITLTTGALTDPISATSVTLVGPGNAALAIDGGDRGRVLVHNGSGRLTAKGLTIAHGSYSGEYGGGCLYSAGDVLFSDVTVSGCSLSAFGNDHAFGGGLYVKGIASLFDGTVITGCSAHANAADSAGGGVWAHDLSLLRATLSDNAVTGDGSHFARGGGAFARDDAQVSNSLVTGNRAEAGGGLFLAGFSPHLSYHFIANSTVSDNESSGAGGGVFTAVPGMKIVNSTIAFNRGDAVLGGGLYFSTGVTLQSTIIAGNTSNDGLTNGDVGGNPASSLSGARNLVVASTRPLPADTLRTDPQLGPLQDNGGLTRTHALAPTSPAIDAGNNVGYFQPFATDQRSSACAGDVVATYERVVGVRADIGAFETGAPDRIFNGNFDAGSPCALD